ncbi:MAG TPA: sigma-70 family RNA polymerase sigma factor [Mycobacteriales bacterium]|nr:sigma-70 family RNA polymerase sigma factor [Mycobacteriales bacterium]
MSSGASFEALVAGVYQPLQRYLRRRVDATTAEDVLGDVLLVMWRRVEDIPAGAELPWCYGVARGCLANALRGSDRHLRLVRRLALERPPREASEDPALDDALQSLAAGERELLRLWAWEHLSAAEIAVVLGVTPNAASLRLHRATTKLKKELLRRQGSRVPGHLGERQGEETR